MSERNLHNNETYYRSPTLRGSSKNAFLQVENKIEPPLVIKAPVMQQYYSSNDPTFLACEPQIQQYDILIQNTLIDLKHKIKSHKMTSELYHTRNNKLEFPAFIILTVLASSFGVTIFNEDSASEFKWINLLLTSIVFVINMIRTKLGYEKKSATHDNSSKSFNKILIDVESRLLGDVINDSVKKDIYREVINQMNIIQQYTLPIPEFIEIRVKESKKINCTDANTIKALIDIAGQTNASKTPNISKTPISPPRVTHSRQIIDLNNMVNADTNTKIHLSANILNSDDGDIETGSKRNSNMLNPNQAATVITHFNDVDTIEESPPSARKRINDLDEIRRCMESYKENKQREDNIQQNMINYVNELSKNSEEFISNFENDEISRISSHKSNQDSAIIKKLQSDMLATNARLLSDNVLNNNLMKNGKSVLADLLNKPTVSEVRKNLAKTHRRNLSENVFKIFRNASFER
jgi:hypothetical protein